MADLALFIIDDYAIHKIQGQLGVAVGIIVFVVKYQAVLRLHIIEVTHLVSGVYLVAKRKALIDARITLAAFATRNQPSCSTLQL